MMLSSSDDSSSIGTIAAPGSIGSDFNVFDDDDDDINSNSHTSTTDHSTYFLQQKAELADAFSMTFAKIEKMKRDRMNAISETKVDGNFAQSLEMGHVQGENSSRNSKETDNNKDNPIEIDILDDKNGSLHADIVEILLTPPHENDLQDQSIDGKVADIDSCDLSKSKEISNSKMDFFQKKKYDRQTDEPAYLRNQQSGSDSLQKVNNPIDIEYIVGGTNNSGTDSNAIESVNDDSGKAEKQSSLVLSVMHFLGKNDKPSSQSGKANHLEMKHETMSSPVLKTKAHASSTNITGNFSPCHPKKIDNFLNVKRQESENNTESCLASQHITKLTTTSNEFEKKTPDGLECFYSKTHFTENYNESCNASQESTSVSLDLSEPKPPISENNSDERNSFRKQSLDAKKCKTKYGPKSSPLSDMTTMSSLDLLESKSTTPQNGGIMKAQPDEIKSIVPENSSAKLNATQNNTKSLDVCNKNISLSADSFVPESKSSQNETKHRDPSHKNTHSVQEAEVTIILSSSDSESSRSNHMHKSNHHKKNEYSLVEKIAEEKKSSSDVNNALVSSETGKNSRHNDSDNVLDKHDNDLAIFSKSVKEFLLKNNITSCEKLLAYDLQNLADTLSHDELFVQSSKTVNDFILENTLCFARTCVRKWKQKAHIQVETLKESKNPTINHDQAIQPIENFLAPSHAKFLQDYFGISTGLALLNSETESISNKLSDVLGSTSFVGIYKDQKEAFCNGMVVSWLDTITEKVKKRDFYPDNINSSSIPSPHNSSGASGSPYAPNVQPYGYPSPQGSSIHKTSQTRSYYERLKEHPSPYHRYHGPADRYTNSYNRYYSPRARMDSQNHIYYGRYNQSKNSSHQNYYTNHRNYNTTNLDNRSYKSHRTGLYHEHSTQNNDYKFDNRYQSHNEIDMNVKIENKTEYRRRGSMEHIKNDNDDEIKSKSNFQMVSQNLSRVKTKLIGKNKKTVTSTKNQPIQKSKKQEPVEKKLWKHFLRKDEVYFLLSRGIETNQHLANADATLLAFHYDKYRSLKSAQQMGGSRMIIFGWMNAAQQSFETDKTLYLVGDTRKLKRKITETNIIPNNQKKRLICNSIELPSLSYYDASVPSSPQKDEMPLLDNVKHLCKLTINEKTGLPQRVITSYDCINEILYEFLIEVRHSSIPGAGLGAFLTFTGANILHPKYRKFARNGELAKTRQTLNAIMPGGKGGVHVNITGKDVHVDKYGIMGPDSGIGLWKEYSFEYFIPNATKTFCSYDGGSGLVEIGRYGPLLFNDRKTDLEFAIKDFIFSLEPSTWRFDVPEDIRGQPQVIDFTSDLTGEPHDEARRNIAMYVNEVGHNKDAIENVVSRDNTRTVSYYLLQEKPLKKGESVELLTDYKSWYEVVRERKGYGKANINGGLKDDTDDFMRFFRNIKERYNMESTIRSYNEDEISNLLLFIKSKILPGIINVTNEYKVEKRNERDNGIISRQWIARRRLHWISTVMKAQLELLLYKYGGSAAILKEIKPLHNDSPDFFPFSPGMLVYVNGWHSGSRPVYSGIASVQSVKTKKDNLRLYSLSLDRGRTYHDVPEGVLTRPTKDELLLAPKRMITAWEKIKDGAKRPKRTKENISILEGMRWTSHLTEKVLSECKPNSIDTVYESMTEEISEEIFYRLRAERKLTIPFDKGNWCLLSNEILRHGVQLVLPFVLEPIETKIPLVQKELLKLARCASKFVRFITKYPLEDEFESSSDDYDFPLSKKAGIEAFSFRGEKFLETVFNKQENEKPKNSFLQQQSNTDEKHLFVVVKDGEFSSYHEKIKLMGGGKKLHKDVEKIEELHTDWYIVHQILIVVNALTYILSVNMKKSWFLPIMYEELKIDLTPAVHSTAARGYTTTSSL